ncbi:EPIDERMAL PATTERNING FACTOR-like protein 2 [Impatiens glandulifera]|uniref:EPIDERMAL PATTERNING FACTOR-like protein 2 n=1 Tax=Impatiens glandulifera TaxID=253017 RepID=UPI001FB111CF|nr:EPIDERMAL PATTERNING FACTOR-like protein 2 [Impatiens glandulifera]
MGCNRNLFCSHHFHKFTISLLFFIISTSTQFVSIADGRKTTTFRPDVQIQRRDQEEKVMNLRAQIGSSPPKCERRCRSCGHCEAIQVPMNPQIRKSLINGVSISMSRIAYDRGGGGGRGDEDDGSNYKPMSWKCKCGDFIFNP